MKKGFTLLELVLVIAVIAILAAIIAPKFMSQVPKAEISAVKANVQNLRSVVGVYRAEVGAYPANLNDLVARGYIRAIPKETISNPDSTAVVGGLTGGGGWVYKPATGDVDVNLNGNDINGDPYSSY